MAVEFDLEDEDEESTGGGGQQLSSGGGIVPGSVSEKSDSPGSASGSYTNLQKYIEANKGRDFGGQVAGKIDEEANQGLNQLGQRESEFKSGVEQNTLKFDEPLKQKITNAPETLGDEEKSQASKLLKNVYSGPIDFSGGASDDPYAALRKQFSGIEETKKAAESTNSQKALLNKYYNRPTYTEGEKALDTYILGGQKEPVQKAAGRLGEAVDKYKTTSKELTDLGTSTKKSSDEAKSQYYSLLGLSPEGDASYQFGNYRSEAPTGLIQKDLYNLESKAKTKNEEAIKAIEQAKTSGRNLTLPGGSVYKNFGGMDRLYGVDPTKFLSRSDVNYQNVASPDDLARLKALTELAGINQDYIDPSLVGTMDDESAYNFDLDRFLLDVNQNKSAYDSLMNSIGESKASRDLATTSADAWAKNEDGSINPAKTLAQQLEIKQLKDAYNDPVSQQQPIFSGQRANYELYKELLADRDRLRNQYGYNDLVIR